MNRPFIVAEISANHLGKLDRALQLVDAAADAGADGLKLQTWSTDAMVGDPNYIQPDGPWAGKNLRDLYREAQTPWIWHKPIFDRAMKRGMIPFSTPFDLEALEFLQRELACELYKVSSFELVDTRLIRAIAATGKPMLMSTGMAAFDEIAMAWQTAYNGGCRDITLLKCTSAYPTVATSVNLAAMVCMQDSFGGKSTSVGISDHTMGSAVAIAATALGATVIEKHLTLKRSDGGPDATFSMEPAEFAQMAKDCRMAASAIGTKTFGPVPGETPGLRRSLWLAKDIARGEPLTEDHIRSARPALGMEPHFLTAMIGRTANMQYHGGTPLRKEMFT